MPDNADSCAAWDEDLSALLDGELEAARASEVRAHVEGCTRCSQRLGALRRVDALLAATPLQEVPGALCQATLARAAAQGSRQDTASARWRAPALGAALVAAATLALYLLGRPAPEVAPEVPPIAETPPPADLPEAPPGERPSQLVLEPLPPPPFPPPPEPEIPEFVPELAPPEPLIADLETEPPEDLAVVLFGVERPDDFDVIANLEILERLLELEEGSG